MPNPVALNTPARLRRIAFAGALIHWCGCGTEGAPATSQPAPGNMASSGAGSIPPGVGAGATAGSAGVGPAGVGPVGVGMPGAGGAGANNGDPLAPPASTIPGVPASSVPPQPEETLTLVRLSQKQWANSLRALFPTLKLESLEGAVTKDALVGFDNEASGLFVTEELRTDLQAVAEEVAARASADESVVASLFPNGTTPDVAAASAFVEHFGKQAFRRPLTAEEVSDFATLFARGSELLPERTPLAAGVALTLEAMLQSPQFLYRTEFGAGVVDGRAALSPHELAAKLAYALTNEPPDAELTASADDGSLAQPDIIRGHVERLIQTEAALRMLEHFSFQAWRMGVYEGISRDPKLFPEFRSTLGATATQSSLQFVRWVFANDGGLKALLTEPVGFVNEELAPLYGVDGSYDKNLTKVDLNPSERAGILTQVGHLAAYAKDHEVDSIRRGVFVNDRILCKELLVPNVNIPPLPPAELSRTNRERVDSFTGEGTCGAACHGGFINPAGFAFEKYDMLGRYRELEGSETIDATGSYAFQNEGVTEKLEFDGAVEFAALLANSPQAHACYAKTWLSYLFARTPDAADEAFSESLGAASLQSGLSVRQLITTLVSDESFRFRVLGAAQ